ncbi:MAG: M13 family metallopeptidase [Nostocoides sp.]
MSIVHSGIDRSAQDDTVRVQDDLFAFANGRWLADVEIPPDRARYGTFDMLRDRAETDCRTIIEEFVAGAASGTDLDPTQRKLADLYTSFMDEARVQAVGRAPLAPLLEEIDQLTDIAEIPALLGRWIRDGVPGLVYPFVNTDDRDASAYIVFLEQGGLGLPDESYYRDVSYAPVRSAYRDHVAAMLALAGVDQPTQAASSVLDVESAIAAEHWDRVSNRDPLKTYTKVSAEELGQWAPAYDWAAWFTAMGAPQAAYAQVVVRQPSFVQAVSRLLVEHPLSTWQAWLRWHLVHEFAPYLTVDIVTENFRFFGETLSGMTQQRARWKRGVALVEDGMGDGLGKAYVQRHFPPAAASRMAHLVDNLVEAFRRDFTDLAWMSPATREQALDKLNRFTPKIGYPQRWKDYTDLRIDAQDLFGNVCRAAAAELDRQLAKLGGPVDRDEWFLTPQTVNAYYNPGLNEIVFPAAILQPPFFDATADDAVNYGGIGAVIGHELGHGFDDQGSRYDGAGELRDWWTQQDRDRFEERAHALIEQFNTLEAPDAPGRTVNGALTVGENIGDLGGLTIGLKAYRIACETSGSPVIDSMTGDQRFFLGWAQVWRGKAREAEAIRLLAIDPHAPAGLRANIARNLTEFHEAFEVEPTDGMWLAEQDRVRIF